MDIEIITDADYRPLPMEKGMEDMKQKNDLVRTAIKSLRTETFGDCADALLGNDDLVKRLLIYIDAGMDDYEKDDLDSLKYRQMDVFWLLWAALMDYGKMVEKWRETA